MQSITSSSPETEPWILCIVRDSSLQRKFPLHPGVQAVRCSPGSSTICCSKSARDAETAFIYLFRQFVSAAEGCESFVMAEEENPAGVD